MIWYGMVWYGVIWYNFRAYLCYDRFHLVAIGTEECERSIAKSAVDPRKQVWEAYLRETMGPLYRPLKGHALQVCLCMCASMVMCMSVGC